MTNFSQKTPFNLAEFLAQPATAPRRQRMNKWRHKAAEARDISPQANEDADPKD